MAQLNGQLKEVDNEIELELRKIVDRVRGQYLAAQQQEEMLKEEFERQKQ